MSTFTCIDCPGVTFPGDINEFSVHRLRHMLTSLTPAAWEAEALRLIREAAASGAEFTIAEALASLGAHPDPGQRQFVNGKLTRRAVQSGLIVAVGAQESVKQSTKSSLVRRWRGRKASAA